MKVVGFILAILIVILLTTGGRAYAEEFDTEGPTPALTQPEQVELEQEEHEAASELDETGETPLANSTGGTEAAPRMEEATGHGVSVGIHRTHRHVHYTRHAARTRHRSKGRRRRREVH